VKSTKEFLEELHKDLGRVSGEVCISIEMKTIHGGRKTMMRWVENLRDVCEDICTQLEEMDKKERRYDR